MRIFPEDHEREVAVFIVEKSKMKVTRQDTMLRNKMCYNLYLRTLCFFFLKIILHFTLQRAWPVGIGPLPGALTNYLLSFSA